ncbi:MAG: hypothetical protein BZY87_02415 [SAR202 cluster bacterium Io17-Chloro-G6]|nr:MAG: hypothetical protein BZY87_02415 [SAR202 cluster bacterium Io17-Chloro-G6]
MSGELVASKHGIYEFVPFLFMTIQDTTLDLNEYFPLCTSCASREQSVRGFFNSRSPHVTGIDWQSLRWIKLQIPNHEYADWFQAANPAVILSRGFKLRELADRITQLTHHVPPLSRGSSPADHHFAAGDNLVIQERYREAVAAYSMAIGFNPDFVAAYQSRGRVYTWLGEYDQAIKDYDESIRLNPESARAYAYRGLAYSDLDQHNRAIEDYGQTVGLDPRYPGIYTYRGLSHHDLGHYQEAIRDYDEAIRLEEIEVWELPADVAHLSPEDPMNHIYRAWAYISLRQYERAIQDLDRAIQLDPKVAVSYAYRAVVNTWLSKDAEASRELDQAVGLGYDSTLLQEEIEKIKGQR